MNKMFSQEAFIKTSYYMLGISIVGMIINVALYISHIIDSKALILVTLILSWLALTFSAYGNIISSQVNKKVENLETDTVETDELKVSGKKRKIKS